MIVGPAGDGTARAEAIAGVHGKLKASYIEACGWVRAELEHEESFYFVEAVFEDDAYPTLFSIELSEILHLVRQAKSYADYLACKEYSLTWLDENLESFSRQRFTPGAIADWLAEAGLESAFQFNLEHEVHPKDRQALVKLTVARCNGNKSEAARQLGISRQRVDQLLRANANSRNPLRKGPASPFDV